MAIEWLSSECAVPDEAIREAALARQDVLTKPPGSLGRLEQIAVDLAALQKKAEPTVDRVEIVVFAADHGVVAEGVSAFPQAVTGEMIKNFVRGGAAINVLARKLDAGLTVVNAGTISAQPFAGDVVDQPVAAGTRNLAIEAAMSPDQLEAAVDLGCRQIDLFAARQVDLVIGGEMGIGNTTAATALMVALSEHDATALTGPGTGLDAAGVKHKQSVIERGLARCPVDADAQLYLQHLGGFEIAALVGYYIRAAQCGIVVLVDGFIASAAALVACRINPHCRPWLLFAHASAEPGHALLMDSLAAVPLLNLGMRLGEGSGAALAVDVLRSACALHNQMATFAEAGVSEKSG